MSLEKPMSKLLGYVLFSFHMPFYRPLRWTLPYNHLCVLLAHLRIPFQSCFLQRDDLPAASSLYCPGDGTFQVIWVSAENRRGRWYLSTRINLPLSTTQSEVCTCGCEILLTDILLLKSHLSTLDMSKNLLGEPVDADLQRAAVMIDTVCPVNKTESPLENKSFGVSGRGVPHWLDWGVKAHPKCKWHNSVVWEPRMNKTKMVTWALCSFE